MKAVLLALAIILATVTMSTAATIQFYGGPYSMIPTALAARSPAVATDTSQFFIGTGSGKFEVTFANRASLLKVGTGGDGKPTWNGQAWPGGGGGTWGSITGTLASQSDLQTALNGKLSTSGTVPVGNLPAASTSAPGIVQLNDSHTSTSTTQGATANQVKVAWDLANRDKKYYANTASEVISQLAAAGAAGGGIVEVGPGWYDFAASLVKPARVSIAAAGSRWMTRFRWTGGNNGVIIDTTNQDLQRTAIEGITFEKSGSQTGVTGILGGSTYANYNSAQGMFRDLAFIGIDYPIRGNGVPNTLNNEIGIFDSYFENIWADTCDKGLWLFGSGNTLVHPRFTNCNDALVLDWLSGESYDGIGVIGGLWANNTHDITVNAAAGKDIRNVSFTHAWFESSTDGIFYAPNSVDAQNVTFGEGCLFQTNSNSRMLDFGNIRGAVSVNDSTVIQMDAADSIAIVAPVTGGNLIKSNIQTTDYLGNTTYSSSSVDPSTFATGSDAITLTAGGINKGIIFTPSGAGVVKSAGNLSVTRSDANSNFSVINTTSTAARIPNIAVTNYAAGYGGYPLLAMNSYNGASGAPGATTNGMYLFVFDGNGHTGTAQKPAFEMGAMATDTFSSSNNPVEFYIATGGTDSNGFLPRRLTINNAGNVGIGTTTPYSLLHLSSDTPRLMVSDSGATESTSNPSWGIRSTHADGVLHIESTPDHSTWTDRVTVSPSGTVTAPAFSGAGALPVYGNTGTALTSPHIVQGSTSGNFPITVTLSGAAVFADTNYRCSFSLVSSATYILVYTKASGSSFTINSTASSGTVDYMCIGN